MIIDKELEFSDGQAITADAASTNIVDLGQSVDVAPGVPLHITAQVDTTFTLLTSLTINVQVDDNASFSSATTIASKTVALADLVAGAQIDLGRIPSVTEQYVRLQYDVTGTNPGAGAVSAFVNVYDRPEGDITGIPGNL